MSALPAEARIILKIFMHGIRIKPDKAGSGFGFDLRDILRLLDAELHKVSQWKVRFIEFIGTRDICSDKFIAPVGGKIGQFHIEHKSWTNSELKDFAELIHQTFDAEIDGYKKTPKGKTLHIRIVAFDTSWWDVFSPDEKVISTIENGFQTTQRIELKDSIANKDRWKS
jgi:hypothetical protein